MLRRLRDLIQLPLTLSRVQTLVAHLIRQQEETNRRLAELHLGLLQRVSAVPPIPPLSREDLETLSSLDSPPKLPSRRPRTDGDVVVASREVLLESQWKQRAAAIAAEREGHPIV